MTKVVLKSFRIYKNSSSTNKFLLNLDWKPQPLFPLQTWKGGGIMSCVNYVKWVSWLYVIHKNFTNKLKMIHLNYYFDFAVCVSVCLGVRVRVRIHPKKLPNSSTYQKTQIRWTDISNSRIQARRAWRLVIYINTILPCNWSFFRKRLPD